MENIIEINKEKYYSEQELNERLETFKKDLVKQTNDISNNQLKYSILDSANVMAIVPFNKEEDIGEIVEVTGLDTFKKVDEKITFYKVDMNTLKPEGFKILETKYSLELLNKANSIATKWLYGKTIPEFYLKWDKLKSEYVQDYPCLIKFDRLVFLLAPRIE